MQVTVTNVSSGPIFVSMLYRQLLPGQSVTTERTAAQLDAEQTLKKYVTSGKLTLTFYKETGDGVGTSTGIAMESYSNSTRPAANAVPAYTAIWNTDDNFTNWSDGTHWRDNDGNLT